MPDATNQGRFGYTGQMYLSELKLYHYRACVYDPYSGRFLQTDPIGYEDQINLYAYVGNDPMNFTDPTGMEINCDQTDGKWICPTQGGDDSKKSDADIYLEGDAARQAVSGATSSTMGDSSGWNPRSLTSEGNSPELSKSEGIFVLLGMTPPGKGLAAAKSLIIGSKVTKQIGARGWTRAAIGEAKASGQQIKAINKANGNPATRYVHPKTGQSVVIDDVTGEVIHVGGPGFKYGAASGDLP